jgi:hypothetical protein
MERNHKAAHCFGTCKSYRKQIDRKTLMTADWFSLMSSENFAAAWAIADDDLRSGRLTSAPKHEGPRHLQRIWRGEPLRGRRVLVRCYHGLGDTIQFCRFLAPLREIAREVILWCQRELIPLLSALAVVDRILPLHDGTPDVAYDVDIEIMELAEALRVDRRHIACKFPYLQAPTSPAWSLARERQELAVGVVWQAGDWNSHRSIAAEALRPLAQVPGVHLYSLQYGPAQAFAQCIPADNICVAAAGIAGLAQRLMQLDLLITVDSMPAHLAGALKRDVWTLLHADCDWRWPRDRSRSVWYPTMRLFHQRDVGSWDGVIEEVGHALAARSHDSRGEPAKVSAG